VNDYSAEATLRSIEGSLNRLQTDRIEIVWVHDVAQDFYARGQLQGFQGMARHVDGGARRLLPAPRRNVSGSGGRARHARDQ
jgi:aryl-alcohol dehydrogenase-like predicted oxidoreductase